MAASPVQSRSLDPETTPFVCQAPASDFPREVEQKKLLTEQKQLACHFGEIATIEVGSEVHVASLSRETGAQTGVARG